MKNLILTLLAYGTLTLSSFAGGNTENPLNTWDAWNPNVINKADAGKGNKYLSAMERDVIFYLNLVRMDGKLFVETFLEKYAKEEKIKKSSYYKSLVEDLMSQPKLSPVYPQQDLSLEATLHAKDMGRSGRIGHGSTSGELFNERTSHLSERYSKLRECNEYGDTDALGIVIMLLVDEDAKNLRRRKSLLNPALNHVGVGTSFHVKYGMGTTILFGGGITRVNDKLASF